MQLPRPANAIVAAAGVLAALFAAAPAAAPTGRRAALAGAGVALLMASVLYAIGQAVQRLLDEDPDAEGDAPRPAERVWRARS